MNDFSANNFVFSRNLSLNCNGTLLELRSPKIMGILNVTPDSFYQGSRFNDPGTIIQKTREMLDEGADLIDVGAFSSRPGAEEIGEEEEIARLHMALGAIRTEFPGLLISVDTYRSGIARTVVHDYQVSIINDITAGEGDPDMIKTIIGLDVPYVIMHMKGKPANMQDNPEYKNVVDEVLQFFGNKVHQLRTEGVKDIIIDPGFGFGKTLDHNYKLLGHLDAFRMLELPIMVGLSRKSMIYKVLNCGPEDSLNGTTALHMAALLKGANILRVHDVASARETVSLFSEIVKIRN